MRISLLRTFSVVCKTLMERGPKYTFMCFLERIVGSGKAPLVQFDKELLFAINTSEVRESGKQSKQHQLGGMFSDISNLEATYPSVHEHNHRILRYSFTPADGPPKGLVVIFHGWGGEFSSGLRPKGWEDYNVLAPWDTYGHNRRGSWFWGEKGDDFVVHLVQSLISKYRDAHPSLPWFCYGGSMGGFGALYHGIKFHADGIYVQMPQIDLERKIVDYGKDHFDNPYGYLQGDEKQTVPNLFKVAAEQDILPPLFLVQNQFDAVNPFAEHGFKLIDIYNRKKSWYGLRIYPAIGHTHDGTPEEASYFFSQIIDKRFPGKFSPK